MGGGNKAPMAFLNKKSWHPGAFKNQEKKWKLEQEAKREEARVEEIKKRLLEEREKAELDALAVAAGVKVAPDRLDWMYRGGAAPEAEAEAEAAAKAEAALLGNVVVEPGAGVAPARVDTVVAPALASTSAALGSGPSAPPPPSANEAWARLHGDPLFAVKQREAAARAAARANPVVMDAVRAQVAAEKGKRDKGKKHKKEKKSKRSRRSRSRSRRRQRTPSPGVDVDAFHRAAFGEGSRAAAPGQRRERSRERSRERRPRSRSRDRRPRSRSRDRRERDRRPRSRNRRPRSRDRRPRSRDRRPRSRSRDRSDRAPSSRVHHDGASAAANTALAYGLNAGAGGVAHDTEAAAAATRARLAAAASEKRAAEKAAADAARSARRRDYAPGQLTAEDKAARLAAMEAAGAAHDAERAARVAAASSADAAASSADAPTMAGADFVAEAARAVHGADGGRGLADAVRRRAARSERPRE